MRGKWWRVEHSQTSNPRAPMTKTLQLQRPPINTIFILWDISIRKIETLTNVCRRYNTPNLCLALQHMCPFRNTVLSLNNKFHRAWHSQELVGHFMKEYRSVVPYLILCREFPHHCCQFQLQPEDQGCSGSSCCPRGKIQEGRLGFGQAQHCASDWSEKQGKTRTCAQVHALKIFRNLGTSKNQ